MSNINKNTIKKWQKRVQKLHFAQLLQEVFY